MASTPSLGSLCTQSIEKAKHKDALEELKKSIISYPDFPKKGIQFWDVFSLLKDATLLKTLFQCLVTTVSEKSADVDVFVGLDSRGFLFGTHLALQFNKPFVPIRKKGKLPGKVESQNFKLEYGEDSFELQEGSIKPGVKVVIVDDLLATGGTLEAANLLIESCSAEVILNLVCIELVELEGRKRVNSKVEALLNL